MIEFDSLKKIKKINSIKSFEKRLKRIISTSLGSYAIEVDTIEGKYLFDINFGSQIPFLLSSNNTLESIDIAKKDLENILSKESDIKNFTVSVDKKFNTINIFIDYEFVNKGNKYSLSLTL